MSRVWDRSSPWSAQAMQIGSTGTTSTVLLTWKPCHYNNSSLKISSVIALNSIPKTFTCLPKTINPDINHTSQRFSSRCRSVTMCRKHLLDIKSSLLMRSKVVHACRWGRSIKRWRICPRNCSLHRDDASSVTRRQPSRTMLWQTTAQTLMARSGSRSCRNRISRVDAQSWTSSVPKTVKAASLRWWLKAKLPKSKTWASSNSSLRKIFRSSSKARIINAFKCLHSINHAILFRHIRKSNQRSYQNNLFFLLLTKHCARQRLRTPRTSKRPSSPHALTGIKRPAATKTSTSIPTTGRARILILCSSQTTTLIKQTRNRRASARVHPGLCIAGHSPSLKFSPPTRTLRYDYESDQ